MSNPGGQVVANANVAIDKNVIVLGDDDDVIVLDSDSDVVCLDNDVIVLDSDSESDFEDDRTRPRGGLAAAMKRLARRLKKKEDEREEGVPPFNLEDGMNKFMLFLDGFRITANGIKQLPASVETCMKMADCHFEFANFKGMRAINKDAYVAASVLVNLGHLQTVQHFDLPTAPPQEPITDEMIAYFAFVLIKIKRPQNHLTYLEDTEELLSDMDPQCAARRALKIMHDKVSTIPMLPIEGTEPQFDQAELIYCKLLENSEISMAGKIYLVYLQRSYAKKTVIAKDGEFKFHFI